MDQKLNIRLKTWKSTKEKVVNTAQTKHVRKAFLSRTLVTKEIKPTVENGTS